MKTNIDIKPVFNYYKAVTYMCGYFSKAEGLQGSQGYI